MQAVRIHQYGGQEVLQMDSVPVPVPGEDDLLIRVHATSVNPIDWKIRAGYLQGWLNYSLPWTLGLDISGTVAAVGANGTGYQVGDAVFAMGDLERNGAYAEYTVVPQRNAAHKPASLSHSAAAALPLAGLTAWNALITQGQLSAGQTVLIHGAAGGVGSLAVQIAKARGAKVIATGSANNQDFLRSLGTDVTVDYTSTPFETAAQYVDLVLDTVGGDTLQRSWQTLKPGGMLVSIVEMPDQEKAAALGVRGAMGSGRADGAILSELARMADAGQLNMVIANTLPLSEIRQAHALSESHHTRGKIVVTVSE